MIILNEIQKIELENLGEKLSQISLKYYYLSLGAEYGEVSEISLIFKSVYTQISEIQGVYRIMLPESNKFHEFVLLLKDSYDKNDSDETIKTLILDRIEKSAFQASYYLGQVPKKDILIDTYSDFSEVIALCFKIKELINALETKEGEFF